ncbi:hypothetical protein JCM16303_005639 [Sporobolomyces ruberrimus]
MWVTTLDDMSGLSHSPIKPTPLATFRLPANPHPPSSISSSRSAPATPYSTPRIAQYRSQHFVEFEPFIPSPPARHSANPSPRFLGVPSFMSSTSSIIDSDGGFEHFERADSTLSDATYDGYSQSFDCSTSDPYYSSTPSHSFVTDSSYGEQYGSQGTLGKRSWSEEQHGQSDAAYSYTPSRRQQKRFRVEPITPITPSSSYTHHGDFSSTPTSALPVARTLSYDNDYPSMPPLARSNTYSGHGESQRPSSARSSFSQNDLYPGETDGVRYDGSELAYPHSGSSSPGTDNTPFLTCTTAQTSYFENTPCDNYTQSPRLLASPLLIPQSAPVEKGHFQPYPELESASMSLSYSLPHPPQQYHLTPRQGRTIHSKRETDYSCSPSTPRRGQHGMSQFQLHSPISPHPGNHAPALVPIPSPDSTPHSLSRRSSTVSNYTPNQAALVSAASMNRLLSRFQPTSPTKSLSPPRGPDVSLGPGVSSVHPRYRVPAPARAPPPSPTKSDKLHECIQDGCGRKFKRLEHLKRHERTHTLEKPYGCDIPGCGRYFSRSDNLAQHRKTHDRNGKTSRAMAAAAIARENAARAAAEASIAQY